MKHQKALRESKALGLFIRHHPLVAGRESWERLSYLRTLILKFNLKNKK